MVFHDVLKRQIEGICRISGVAGASVGVFTQGSFHAHHYGYRDIEAHLQPSSSTLYGIGSMSKAMVTSGLAILVEEGRLRWDSLVKDVLPAFHNVDTTYEQSLTVTDLLSHRSGLAPGFSLPFQGNGESLMDYSQILPLVGALKPILPLRTEWLYCSWGYCIAGLIIENIAAQPLYQFLKEKVFDALGMNSTTLRPSFDEESEVAEPYTALEDASLFHLPYRQTFLDTPFEAAGGVFSTLDDMMTWAKAVMEAIPCNRPGGVSSKLKQMPTILSPYIPMLNPTFRERSYSLGWMRVQLPGVVGVVGDNTQLFDMDELPLLGKGGQSLLNVCHNGSTVGYYSAIHILPETETAIVVLTNSMSLNDGADWIIQAVTQALLSPSEGINYEIWATMSAQKRRDQYHDLKETLEKEKPKGGKASRPLDSYTGSYYNGVGNFFIEISLHPTKPEHLQLAFQGRPLHTYELRHYHDDVFEWSLTLNETVRNGRYHEWSVSYFKMAFSYKGEENTASSLQWVDDPSVPEGQIFQRRGDYD